MKKKMSLFVFVTLFSILLSGCKKPDGETGTPKCLQAQIEVFKNNSCSTGAKVCEYTFQGDIVYVFDPGTCGADMASNVTDTDCHSIGFLGGISGNTKIKGEEFSEAIFIKTIWSN